MHFHKKVIEPMSDFLFLILNEAATKLERQAKRLRYEAKQYEGQPKWAQQYGILLRSIEPDATIEEVMQVLGCSHTLASEALQRLRTKANLKSIEERNALIMRLASRGWTNKQIAAKCDLHPTSISKIIQKVMQSGQLGRDHRKAAITKNPAAIRKI
ncbi:MAG: hypothetical protein COA52_09635 [Hyphomicrobiales bacterium]|nr:MAG: hypothetical protein COA52_09635 [Hyphomicrobiales bacterium]